MIQMKKLIFLQFLWLCILGCNKSAQVPVVAGFASGESEMVKKWKDNKLAMFVHFGLYSWYGGVYQGQPVTKGYSEQIMAHAPINAQEYQASAANFNPEKWNADSLVNLAIQGGLRSIVITAKHHDGNADEQANHNQVK